MRGGSVSIAVDHEALDRAGVLVAYVFGSRGAGTARPDSDLDVAVLADDRLDLSQIGRIASLLAESAGIPEVDVVDLRAAPLPLAGRVAQEGRLIHSSDEAARVEFEAETRVRYLDFLPTLQRLDRAFVRHVAERGL